MEKPKLSHVSSERLNQFFDDCPTLETIDELIIFEEYLSLEQKYASSQSETFRSYHNHLHALDVMQRAQRIWEELSLCLPEKFTAEDSRLLAIAAIFHDDEQNLIEQGVNEAVSGEKAAKIIEDYYLFYPGETKNRVSSAITATTVLRDEDGTIRQSNIRTGSKDPLKLVLAIADINGIAMGGIPVMIDDALNLFMEINNYRACQEVLNHAMEFGRFLQTQAKFLRDRLADLDGDVDYYFEEESERQIVKSVLSELFQPGIKALEMALVLEKPENVAKCVNSLVHSGVTTLADMKARIISLLPKSSLPS